MSTTLFNGFPGALPVDVDTRSFGGGVDALHCVNPQYTDKRYSYPLEDQSLTVPSGLMTPSPSRNDSVCRRPSLAISDTRNSYIAGPSSASSGSSFESPPTYTPSCSSSASTAPSSRRQSVIYHDNQHHYSSASSPSPIFRSRQPKQALNRDHYILQEPFSTDHQVNCSDTSFTVAADVGSCSSGDDFLVAGNEYPDNSQMEWQGNEVPVGGLTAYELPRDNSSACLTMDLVPNFDRSLNSRIVEYSETNFANPQPGIFADTLPQHGVVPSQTTFEMGSTALAPGFVYNPPTFHRDMSCSDDDDITATAIAGTAFPLKSLNRKGKPSRRAGNKRQEPVGWSSKPHKCEYFGCGYACNRPEHLNRHIDSRHNPTAKDRQCVFTDCIDKKTGLRKIIHSRNDNYKMHYSKTHFSYGNTEKSGKNRRRSMKVSMEEGLRNFDARWTMLLAGKMSMDENVDKFLSVWKMLGYSIRETRDIKVKDLAPEWQGPDETTLEALDPRWEKMRDGTLTFEQAMSVGMDMLETPKQGLLGVDMWESEKMGLKEKDPRWNTLLSGQMSIDDSEKLGMKQHNPAWITLQGRRKR